MDIYFGILIIHIIAGFTALFVGLLPMFSKKGSRLHIQSGKVYFYAMFGVFLTSSIMFLFKPDRLLFLFLIGIFSFYQTFSGSRAVKYKKPGNPIAPLDWLIAGLILIAGLFMIGMGGYSFLNGEKGLAILYTVFGSICTSNGFTDLKYFKTFQAGTSSEDGKAWLYKHVSRMGGSYIATFTAFCVVNVSFLPDLIVWLAPGIIGSVLVGKAIRQLKSKSTSTAS